jgi:hypothetical protein
MIEPKPLSPEQRERIRGILRIAPECVITDGDWPDCYGRDVEDLLAAEAYWRNLIAKRNPWCDDYHMVCEWCGSQTHKADCPWVLAQ